MVNDPTCSWYSPEFVSWEILHPSSSISPLFLIQVTVGVGLPVINALKIAVFPIEMGTRMYRYVYVYVTVMNKVAQVIGGVILPYLLE